MVRFHVSSLASYPLSLNAELLGLGPCAEEAIAFKEYTYTRQRLAEYNDVVTKVANELEIVKVEIYHLLLNSSTEVFYRDKLHPNDEGYRLIYEAVKPVVMDLLER